MTAKQIISTVKLFDHRSGVSRLTFENTLSVLQIVLGTLAVEMFLGLIDHDYFPEYGHDRYFLTVTGQEVNNLIIRMCMH